MKSFTSLIEQQEMIAKLRAHGLSHVVDALLENEQLCYTKKARLNKSGACRVLGCKTKELEDALEECKRLLEPEMGD